MNASWAIDASIGFAWVHPSQGTDETDRLLDEIESGASMIVPALWFAEVANSLLVLQRRKKLTSMERKAALETLSKFNFIIDEEAGKTALGRTSDLAEHYNLTIYDATYLELAIRRKLPLASRDESLNHAAKKAGIKTL